MYIKPGGIRQSNRQFAVEREKYSNRLKRQPLEFGIVTCNYSGWLPEQRAPLCGTGSPLRYVFYFTFGFEMEMFVGQAIPM